MVKEVGECLFSILKYRGPQQGQHNYCFGVEEWFLDGSGGTSDLREDSFSLVGGKGE